MGEDWYRMQGIDVTSTDRGGRVTYRASQLVAYPIMSLRELVEPDDVPRLHPPDGARNHRFARRLGHRGAPLRRADRRLGLRASATGRRRPQDRLDRHPREPGVTTHGLAINVNNDRPFEWWCRAESRPAA